MGLCVPDFFRFFFSCLGFVRMIYHVVVAFAIRITKKKKAPRTSLVMPQVRGSVNISSQMTDEWKCLSEKSLDEVDLTALQGAAGEESADGSVYIVVDPPDTIDVSHLPVTGLPVTGNNSRRSTFRKRPYRPRLGPIEE